MDELPLEPRRSRSIARSALEAIGERMKVPSGAASIDTCRRRAGGRRLRAHRTVTRRNRGLRGLLSDVTATSRTACRAARNTGTGAIREWREEALASMRAEQRNLSVPASAERWSGVGALLKDPASALVASGSVVPRGFHTSQRRTCILVYDAAEATNEDRLLVGELERRGLDVHVIVAPRKREKPGWAPMIRSRIEALASPRPVVSLRSLVRTPIREVTAAESVAALVASLEPLFVIHFADRETAAMIADLAGVEVFQVWLVDSRRGCAWKRSRSGRRRARARGVAVANPGDGRACRRARGRRSATSMGVGGPDLRGNASGVALFLRALDRSVEAEEGKQPGHRLSEGSARMRSMFSARRCCDASRAGGCVTMPVPCLWHGRSAARSLFGAGAASLPTLARWFTKENRSCSARGSTIASAAE